MTFKQVGADENGVFPTRVEAHLAALIAATGTNPEVVRDTMGAALVAGTNVTITVNDPADTITIAADLSAAAPALLSLNAQTGTTYTLVLADAGKLVTLSNAAAIALTVPPNSSVPFAVGTQIHLAQIGAGQVTVGGGVGVTVNGAPGLKLTDQWSSATLIKRLTDTWLLVGRLSA